MGQFGKKIKSITVYLYLIPIFIYRNLISPVIGNNCRFVPTCSEYSIEAIKKFGIWKGTYLSFKRIIKCSPLGGSGSDPIPKKSQIDEKK